MKFAWPAKLVFTKKSFTFPTQSTKKSPELEELLQSLLNEATNAWPQLPDFCESFTQNLAERIPENGNLKKYLLSLKIPDLYLAHVCAGGNTKAIELFQKEYTPVIAKTLNEANVASDAGDEIRQVLWERFFIRRGERRPAILTYSGRGRTRFPSAV